MVPRTFDSGARIISLGKVTGRPVCETMAKTIRIAVAEGDVPPDQIDILIVNVQKSRENVVRIPLPNQFVTEEIRWYLEDFAQYNPFERERATDAESALTDHGRQLGFFIHCSQVLEGDDLLDEGSLLLVEVEDSPNMPPELLWEALERPIVLESIPNVDAAVVTRVFTSGSSNEEMRDTAFQGSKGELTTLNVLIVSARADLEADISHRLVAHQALGSLETLAKLEPALKEFTRVEVIHPATFDAFRAHLEGRQPGYFSLVHFDLHGGEDSAGK